MATAPKRSLTAPGLVLLGVILDGGMALIW